MSKRFNECSGKLNGLNEINLSTQVVRGRYYKWNGVKFGEQVRYSVLQLSIYNGCYPLKTRNQERIMIGTSKIRVEIYLLL